MRTFLLSFLVLGSGCDDSSTTGAPTADPAPAKTPKSTLPELDTVVAATAVEAVEGAEESNRGKLAARALAELEEARLGKSFVRGLTSMYDAPPDRRASAAAKAIHDNIAMLDEACEADAEKTMQAIATMDPAARNAALWDACKFETLGLVTKDVGVEADPVAVLFAHMAYARIQKDGAVDPSEKKLLQVLAAQAPDDA